MTPGEIAPLPVLHGSSADSFAYFGEREGWLIALQVNRDSDTVDRSNWRVIVPAMLEQYPEDAAVERMHHWAVGWVDYLLVRPMTLAHTAAVAWRDKLAEYPVADEIDLGELEYAEGWCVRCDSGTREDHPLHGCPFRSADDADEIVWRWHHRHESSL